MSQPSHSDIAQRAFQIWESEGRPHGRDRDHWHRAEREILGAGAAKNDRPGDIRSAEQANPRQTGAASPGRPAHPAAPSTIQAAASTTKRTQQAPGSQSPSRSAQTQAGQPAGNKAQQSSSGKAEPSSGEKVQSTSTRKPRAPRQTNP
jgi:hypothetical protein